MRDENDAQQAGALPADPAVGCEPWPEGDNAEERDDSTPHPPEPPAPDPTDETAFRMLWGEANETDRDKLLRALLTRVDELDTLQRGRFWIWLRDCTGLGIRILKAAAAELRPADDDPGLPPPPEGGCIDYVTNQDTLGELFDKITKVLADAGHFYGTDKEIVAVEDDKPPQPITPGSLPGKLSDYTEIRFLRVFKDADYPLFQGFGPLPADLSRAYCASSETRRNLPPLRHFIQSPQFSGDWRWVATPGYHPDDGGTFYAGPLVEPLPQGKTITLIPRLLEHVCWKEDADLANFVGALLTSITMPHWSNGVHPAIVVNANRPDAGKTTLIQILAILWEGTEAPTVTHTHDDTELEKQLATICRQGRRLFLLDNVKSRRAVGSAVLERSITAPVVNFRRLGQNDVIGRPTNDVWFALTMNDTLLGQDMRSRAMPINLFMEHDRPPGAPCPKIFAQRHRIGILGELAAMVERWRLDGCHLPENPARYAKGDVWAATIDGMLRPWGIGGFMSNVDEARLSFDPRFALMVEIAEEFQDESSGTAGMWVARLELTGYGDQVGFKTRRGAKTKKQKEHVVVRLFKDFVGKPLKSETGEWLLERVDVSTDKGMRPGYVFRAVGG